MRPRNDVEQPLSADPTETIHFLRHSNEQWQATAERIARQRDEALQVVKDIDTELNRFDDPRATLVAIDELVSNALGRG